MLILLSYGKLSRLIINLFYPSSEQEEEKQTGWDFHSAVQTVLGMPEFLARAPGCRHGLPSPFLMPGNGLLSNGIPGSQVRGQD